MGVPIKSKTYTFPYLIRRISSREMTFSRLALTACPVSRFPQRIQVEKMTPRWIGRLQRLVCPRICIGRSAMNLEVDTLIDAGLCIVDQLRQNVFSSSAWVLRMMPSVGQLWGAGS